MGALPTGAATVLRTGAGRGTGRAAAGAGRGARRSVVPETLVWMQIATTLIALSWGSGLQERVDDGPDARGLGPAAGRSAGTGAGQTVTRIVAGVGGRTGARGAAARHPTHQRPGARVGVLPARPPRRGGRRARGRPVRRDRAPWARGREPRRRRRRAGGVGAARRWRCAGATSRRSACRGSGWWPIACWRGCAGPATAGPVDLALIDPPYDLSEDALARGARRAVARTWPPMRWSSSSGPRARRNRSGRAAGAGSTSAATARPPSGSPSRATRQPTRTCAP